MSLCYWYNFDIVGLIISVTNVQPKCGFTPSSSYIADRNAIKKNVTRFRMHQVLKLQQHQVTRK